MKKTTRKHNKGFTLVELVVVIAIIAILGAVSVVGYFAFINKAKVSNDQSLVVQLNTTLQADEVINGKAKTPSEALNTLEEHGFIIEKMNPTSEGYSFVWNQETNRLALIDDKNKLSSGELSDTAYFNWQFINNADELVPGYSACLNSGFKNNEITLNASIDTNFNKNIKRVNYKNAGNVTQDIILATDNTNVIVESNADNITHYGQAGAVSIGKPLSQKQLANANTMINYFEFGLVDTINLTSGIVNTEEGSKVNELIIPESVTSAAEVEINIKFPNTLTNIVSSSEEIVNNSLKGESSNVKTVSNAKYAKDITELTKHIFDLNVEYIVLTDDIHYETNDQPLSINHNLVLNGAGHTLSGFGHSRNNRLQTLMINNEKDRPHPISENEIDVTLKNISILGHDKYITRTLETRGNVKTLTLDNVYLESKGMTQKYGDGDKNAQVFSVGGRQTTTSTIVINDSKIVGNTEGYCVTSFNPMDITCHDTYFESWGIFNVKFASDSEGSHGSTITLDDCEIISENVNVGYTNSFSAIKLEDGNITLNIMNTYVYAHRRDGGENQYIVGYETIYGDDFIFDDSTRFTKPGFLKINLSGDNIFDGQLIDPSDKSKPNNVLEEQITITGGKYASDIDSYIDNETHKIEKEGIFNKVIIK